MSGIVGFLGLDSRPVAPLGIRRMTERIGHRGPDRLSIWTAGSVGLGHCMRQTTPESLDERLPLEIDGFVITADARIDNREDLIKTLGLGGWPRTRMPDSRVIIAAYTKWGERCVERLIGDFSFAIWDKGKRMLFCARDHFGVRPFYYYHAPGRFFAFASEIKALFCIPAVPCQINEHRIGDYLATTPGDKVATFYQNIMRLAPAHAVSVSPSGFAPRAYWVIDVDRELRLDGDQHYASAYKKVFNEAVHCRLRSAFPIGSALSGGLDSSAIVCVARHQLRSNEGGELQTFSGVFDGVQASDERIYIRSVVQQGGIEPHYILVDHISPLVDLQRVLWHIEEPIWTPNLYLHWGLYNCAKAQGIRVFLDGFLGDNIVGHGWDYFKDLAFAWRWPQLVKELKAVAKKKGEYSYPRMAWQYFLQFSLNRLVPRPGLSPVDRIDLQRSPGQHRLSPIINPDFAQRIDLAERQAQMQLPVPAPPGAARKRLYQDMNAGEISLALEAANKLASSFSLDARYPFADPRLAEFSMALPAKERIHDGLSRMIVRRALNDQLPQEICWRSDKGNLEHNLQLALLKHETPLLDDLFLTNRHALEPYVDVDRLDKVYASYKRDQRSVRLQEIWSAANLAAWLRHSRDLASPPTFTVQQPDTEGIYS